MFILPWNIKRNICFSFSHEWIRTGTIELQKWQQQQKKSIHMRYGLVCVQNPNIQSPLWSLDNNVPDPKASEELKYKVHKSDWPFLCYFLPFLEKQMSLNEPAWYLTVLIWLNFIICTNQCLSVVERSCHRSCR